MHMNVLCSCLMGFFIGRMLAKGELNQFLLGAMTVITIVLVFSLTKYRFGARKAWMLVGITISIMVLTIGVMTISQKITRVYHTDPVFHAKVNAYIFMDPRWQAQLDPYWFTKRRALIDQRTDRLRRMRSGCNSNLTEAARTYNMEINDYNRALVGSMVGVQYVDPVRQLLVPQFNDQLAPCGEVFKPL